MSSPGSGLAMVTVGRTLLGDAGIAVETSNAMLQHCHIVRCFMHKLAQVVVQSRYGNVPTSDKVPDWEIIGREQELHHVSGLADSKFHLDLLDNVDITEQFERLLGDWELTPGNAFTVQILIRTVDGELFVMEMWSLVMTESHSSAPSRHNDTSQLYAKLSGLLKSVIVASRISPGYQISFQQSAQSYVMFYTITTSTPNTKHLGSDYQEWLFPAVSCSEGLYRLEVRYRTEYLRDADFNCSILHRDKYYTSLASLTDAAFNTTVAAAVTPGGGTMAGPHLPHYSSDKHLDRAAGDGWQGGAVTATAAMPPRYQPAHHHYCNQQHRQKAAPDGRSGGHQQRRVSVEAMRRQVCESSSPTATGGVICSSLPTKISFVPPHAVGSPGASNNKYSSRNNSSRNSPSHLPKSPPTAIPKASDNSSSFCPFAGNSSAPPVDAYIVPRVTLPPGDLFASVIHGSVGDDTAGLAVSSDTGTDDDEDHNTTPPNDLNPAPTTAGDAPTGGQGPRSAGSAGGEADYVLVDNPSIFMENRSPHSELGLFYHACKNAPRLFTSSSITDIADSAAGSPRSVSHSNTSGGSGQKVSLAPCCGGVVVPHGHVDQDELFSQGKNNSFGADALLQDRTEQIPFDLRLKQFEDNLGHFNSLVESLHSSSELEPT